jgi:hypothetical protein
MADAGPEQRCRWELGGAGRGWPDVDEAPSLQGMLRDAKQPDPA